MSVQNTILKSVTSRFASRLSRTATTASQRPQDEDQLFLASIAHLPLDEQVQRIQRRAMYQRMAHRQGIMEIERSAYSQRNERS